MVVFCLEQRANDLHIIQLMPLSPPLSVASLKSRMALPFWCQLIQIVLEKSPLNECVCLISVLILCVSWQFGLILTCCTVSTEMGDHFVGMPFWYLNRPPSPTQPGHPLWVGALSTDDGLY